MGSIVPGAGAVPGAEREDPGRWGWGAERCWHLGTPEWGAKERNHGRENGIGQLGQVGVTERGVCREGSR